MAIIKIDGLITTSIAEAEDILADGVSTTDFLPEGTNHLYFTNARADGRVDLQTGANLDLSSKTTTDLAEGTNLYYTDVRAVDAVEATSTLSINQLTANNGNNPTSTHQAFAAAAIQAVSGTWGTPLYALRSTTNTSWEPAKWGTGHYELKFDADLTGVNMDGTSQTIAFNIGDRNNAYSVSGLDSKIVNTVIDANGDIESFNGEIEFRVNDQSAGGGNMSFPLRISSDQIEIKSPIKSFFNDGNIMAGGFNDLLDSKRIETNSGRWNRSRSAMRATTNADLDDGNGIQQFSGGFGTDTSYSINNSEIATIGVAVNGPSFNVDNTLDYGIGQSSLFNVRMRGEGYAPGTPPLESFKIEPWSSRYTINSSSGTDNLRLETNAPAIEDTKPHVFVNLTTTERDALTAEPGMMIFNTDGTPKLQCYDGTVWNDLH